MRTMQPTAVRELLTSQRDAAGVWHAVYPTAVMTLCSKPVDELLDDQTGELPTCGRCSKTARRFHTIDGSMPDRWLPDSAAA